MAHKFRIQFGKRRLDNMPANSEFCSLWIYPLSFIKVLPIYIRMAWSFRFRRGTVGGALLFDSFSITFPMPKKPRKHEYDVRFE